MSVTNAVKQFAVMKVAQICAMYKDKELPNWAKFEDMHSWAFRINEGDLNFQVNSALYQVSEAGAGNFLVKLSAALMTSPVRREGFEIMSVPVFIVELDFQLYAEDEQELQNGLLQLISDESDNILCQLLDNSEVGL